MKPSLQELLATLRTVDEADEERVVQVDAWLVWSFRAKTRHPRLSGFFPTGFLLITGRREPLEDSDGVDEALDTVRVPLPKALGDCEEPLTPEFCAAPPNAQRGTAMLGPSTEFESTLEEGHLAPVSLSLGRNILSEMSRTRTCLSLPLLIAVTGRPREQHESIVYLGTQTAIRQQDENRPPTNAGLSIIESINVFRPKLPPAGTIGDILRCCQGARYGNEVRLRTRYDLSMVREDPTVLALRLPADLSPGSFISLVVSWPMSLQQAASLHLLQPPSTLSCSSAIYMRCGHCPERSLLGRYLLDLHVLRGLADPDACGLGLQNKCRTGVLGSPSSVLAAVARFIEKERRLATCSVAMDGQDESAQALERQSAVKDADDEDRPDRDFVDRLWLDVLACCETAPCLVAAIEAVLKELGCHDGIAPSVRRDNGSQMAEIVRTAVRMSTLRKYAALSEAEQLREVNRSWEESCKHLSRAEHVVPLVLSIGIECLRRDFVHLITHRGYVTAQDLGQYTEVSEPITLQLDRLSCLRNIAELALMSTRHRLWMDTMRRLILKAAEYYQRPSKTAGTSIPIFAVPLSSASLGRLLSALPSLEPSAFAIECGGTSIQAERVPGVGVCAPDEQQSPEPGVWRPPQSSSLFEYHVTVVDRFRYTK